MSGSGAIGRFIAGYTIVRGAKRGFWALQLVGLLDTMAYWAMVGIVAITLSDDFGFSDVEAGALYTLSVIATTASFLVAGTVVDALGVRRALTIGYAGSLLARGALFVMAFAAPGELRLYLIIGAFVAMGPCVAMLQTIYSVGSQIYAPPGPRSAGFNVVYLGLNIGAAGAGFMIDFFYLGLGLPRFYILGAGAVLALICLVCTLLRIPERTDDSSASHEARRPALPQLLRRALREATFWRLMTFMVLLTPVRAALIYYVLIAPKYWLRMIGADASIGFYEALNPILVVVGTVLFIPYLARANVYRAIAIGSLISACSLFFLAIPVHDPGAVGRATEIVSLLFIVTLTVGEFTWAPRLWEYTAAVAPRGLEATYLGVTGLPLGLSKMGIAFASGYMLQRWCPPGVADAIRSGTIGYWDSPAAMWLLLGLLSFSAAVAVLVLRPWITRGTLFDAPRGEA